MISRGLRLGNGVDKEFEINGCVIVSPNITYDDFWDAFIGFVESKGIIFERTTAEESMSWLICSLFLNFYKLSPSGLFFTT